MIPTGTRVRILDTCSWPERRGLQATVVTDRLDSSCYPVHGKLATEVVVLIDDDPLAQRSAHPEAWSCVMSEADMEVIE